MRPACGRVFSTLIQGVQSRSPGHCRCQSGRGGSASALTLGLGLRLWPARGVHHARGLLLLNAAGACEVCRQESVPRPGSGFVT